MPDDAPHRGGCACGAVRYRLLAEPLFVHGCHCRDCQRETGSALAINALIETDRIEVLKGEIEASECPTASGKGQTIFRCASCKVAFFSRYAYGRIADALRFVRVGTLDDPDRLPPDIHIFTRSKQPWLTLPPDKPALPEFYRAGDHWPQASLQRRAALFAALEGGG